jgi:hypothetical protein
MNENEQMTADEKAGIDWWNALTEAERDSWCRAANTPTPAVAWDYCKRASEIKLPKLGPGWR